MTIKFKSAVQKNRSQLVQVDFGDLPSGVFTPLITLPPGALIVNGATSVVVASDAATSEALAVGTATTGNLYGGVANSKTAGRTALTLPAGLTQSKTVIGVTRTAVGTPTVGTYLLYVEYALAGGSDSTQG